jgi:porin
MATKQCVQLAGCMICLFFCSTIASAQVGPTTAPTRSTDATTVTPAESEIAPFQLTLPTGHLFGDWAGARTDMVNAGITPDLNLETDMAGNPTGGKREAITEASNLGLSFQADLNKMAGINGASFLLQFSERWGDSLSKQYIGNLFDTQQVYGGESFRLVDAAYQQQLLDDHIELRVGRISANDDFQVSQFDYFFMQNGFDGNPVGIYFDSPGMSAYPDATWGSLVKVLPTQRTYAMVGVYNGDPKVRGINRHGWDMTMHGPVFVIGEAGLQVNGLPGDKGLIGDYKLGAWYDASTQAVFGTTTTQTGSSGEYALFDQVLVPFGPRETNRGLGIFSSATFSNNPDVGTMPYFFTAGAFARGILDCRPTDEMGLGVLYGLFSDNLRFAEQQTQLVMPSTVVQDYELVIELAYRVYLLDRSVYVQPDLQFINHPNGNARVADAFVVGCRLGIDF